MPLVRQKSEHEKPQQPQKMPHNQAEIAAIANKTQKGCEPKIHSPFFLQTFNLKIIQISVNPSW